MTKDKTLPAGASPAVPDVPLGPLLPDDHLDKQRVTEFRAQHRRTMDVIMQWCDPAEDARKAWAEARAARRPRKPRKWQGPKPSPEKTSTAVGKVATRE
jgi:hypothetical protein